MQNNIFLRNNKGFSWYSKNNFFVKGYLFDNQENYYENGNLLKFFSDIFDKKSFIEKINNANGVFTVLIKKNNEIFIASDTSRMFPLFYCYINNSICVSDDIVFLKNKFNFSEIDNFSANAFLTSGHTMGNKTLFEGIKQVQSNEYLIFKDNKLKNRGFFFSYSIKTLNNSTYTKLKEQTTKLFDKTFERLVKSLNNRHVALPLSGGYDSRLIATMLKKYNYNNVTCFTYGKKGLKETEVSRMVAEKLSYKWYFIEYSENLTKNFITDKLKEYANFVGKYSSMPMFQEYFAVKYLKDNKLIPENSIFIPGHSGDLLGGSQYMKVFDENVTVDQIPDLLFKKKFFFNKTPLKYKTKIKKIIKTMIEDFNEKPEQYYAYSLIEDFDIKEKIAKFIINSSSVYNYFGYEHRLPYWDKEMLLFFRDIPLEYKKMKLLYDEVLKNEYFSAYNVNFKTELQPTNKQVQIQKIKDIIKKFLPQSCKNKLIKRNDWLNSYLVSKQLKADLNKKKIKFNNKIYSNNSIYIQWYLKNVINKML